MSCNLLEMYKYKHLQSSPKNLKQGERCRINYAQNPISLACSSCRCTAEVQGHLTQLKHMLTVEDYVIKSYCSIACHHCAWIPDSPVPYKPMLFLMTCFCDKASVNGKHSRQSTLLSDESVENVQESLLQCPQSVKNATIYIYISHKPNEPVKPASCFET